MQKKNPVGPVILSNLLLRVPPASVVNLLPVFPFFRFSLPLLALLAFVVAGCDGKPGLYAESRLALGSVTVEIQVVAASEVRAHRAVDAAFAAISQVNNLMSSYLAQSEISRLNGSSGSECHVSSQTAFVLRRAIEISELTGGAFDVTAGPLIKLWKHTIKTGKLPAEADLAAARKLVGYKKLVLGPNSARFTTPGMSVDLGGIAKGYAVDKAIEALKAAGITSALVDAGGDGYALGTRPDGSPWLIAIQNPNKKNEDTPLPGPPLLLSNMAYATSGDYRQYVDIGGVRYAHIIDPQTGQPARAAASVTVIAPDCTTADALATALSVLGPDDGLAIIKNFSGVECTMITRAADGLRISASPGFKRFLLGNTSAK